MLFYGGGISIATTGIWKIDVRLDHVIDYITNEQKTSSNKENNYIDLHNFKEYQSFDFTTEQMLYVSGINCTPEIAYDEMMITKKRFNKTSGILGFHAFQSFKENEVSPELAHTIGVGLANEMWGDRFEIVVATHINTNHIHNHFVINSVSFRDGKRYYDNRSTYAELRHLSDDLCKEHGLSVVKEKPCRRSGINFENYYKSGIEKNNYYTIAKEDLDRAIQQSFTYNDFEKMMKAMNYELYYRYNKLSIRRIPYKKNIRVERIFGEDYTIANIKERIQNTYAPRVPFPEVYHQKNSFYSNYDRYSYHKYHGFYGLYLHYLYLLKKYTKNNQINYLSPNMRLDIKKMDDISKETRLLVGKNLETYQQFFLYKEEANQKLNQLLGKRDNLWYQYRKSKSNNEKIDIRKQIDILSKDIEPLKEENRLLDSINGRIPNLEDKIKDYEKEKINEREVDKNEHVK